MKVFKRVTSKCLTSMYAFTIRFPKSTVGGFFLFIDRYPCRGTFTRLVPILTESGDGYDGGAGTDDGGARGYGVVGVPVGRWFAAILRE